MAASHGYGYRWDGVVDREGRMIETIRVPRGEGRVTMLHRRSADGSRTDTVAMPSSCSDLAPPSSEIRGRSGATAVPFAARIINVLTADGAVWCALTDEYKPRRFAFGAPRHDRELFLAAPRVPIPSAERDAAIAETEAFLARVGGAVEPWSRAMVPRDRGPLHWFEEDDVGRLWVLRQRPDQGFEFDVWDRAGLRIATLTAPIGGDYLPLFRVVNGKLATLVLDEDELPVVAVYLIRER